MKQVLFILLIATIACASIEKFEEEDLEIVLEGINFKSLWNKVKKHVTQAKAWLKAVGLYDPLMNALKNIGGYYAQNYCVSKGIPSDVCTSIVSFLTSTIFSSKLLHFTGISLFTS